MQQPLLRWRFNLAGLMLAVLALAMLLTIWRRFMFTFWDLDGLGAGAILLGVGTVVGNIIGGIPAPRYVIICLSSTLFLGITQGFMDAHEEHVLFALTLMSLGLLIGALHRTLKTNTPENSSVEVSETSDS